MNAFADQRQSVGVIRAADRAWGDWRAGFDAEIRGATHHRSDRCAHRSLPIHSNHAALRRQLARDSLVRRYQNFTVNKYEVPYLCTDMLLLCSTYIALFCSWSFLRSFSAKSPFRFRVARSTKASALLVCPSLNCFRYNFNGC